MADAMAWAATLGTCAFILFMVYGGVLPSNEPGGRTGLRVVAEAALHCVAHRVGIPTEGRTI